MRDAMMIGVPTDASDEEQRWPAHRVTITDVAHEAGVSVASASKVVRGAYGASDRMRAKVGAAVELLGYRPHRLAQGLRGPTRTIGVLLPDIENPHFDVMIRGMAEVLAQSGLEFFVALGGSTPEGHAAATESLIDHRMDGLILVSPRGTSERLERVGREIPSVVVGRHGPAAEYDTVSSDDARGSHLVVEHLVALGHRRIAFLANDSGDDASLPESVRLTGYRAAMSEAGLGDCVDVVRTPWSSNGGRDAARALANRDTLPSAVHAGADVAALGLLDEFWAGGIEVPGDVSVVGYDNSPLAQLKPVGLTSVDQSGQLMGQLAAHLLLERISGRSTSVHRLLEPRLVVRSSTSRVR